MGGKVVVSPDDDFEPRYVAPPASEVKDPEVAAFDLLIERPDLGAGMATQVRKGQPIPVGLDKLPRRRADAASRVKTSRTAPARKGKGARKRT
jgi:hypothetical protein